MGKAVTVLIIFAVIAMLGYAFWQPSGPNADEQEAYYEVIREHRAEKDAFFRESKESPLSPEQRQRFSGLNYFPPSWTFRFTAQLDRFDEDEREPVTLATSDGKEKRYRPIGKAYFRSGSKRLKLIVYQEMLNAEAFFVPFRDLTTGESTYPAGRYLEPKVRGNVIELDFNYAYNPYCAYNEKYSCPLPPEENQLEIAVEAGEKNYKAQPVP